MRGKWAAGIPPRNFTWVIRDGLAISERPGGFAPHHRRVRRHEEIVWLRGQGFTTVVSLLPSTHNLQAYAELEVPALHRPLPSAGDVRPALADLLRDLHGLLLSGRRVLVHQDDLSDRVVGVAAAYLWWSGRLANAQQAITVLEHLVGHPLAPVGRELVTAVSALGGSSGAVGAPRPT